MSNKENNEVGACLARFIIELRKHGISRLDVHEAMTKAGYCISYTYEKGEVSCGEGKKIIKLTTNV